jgi:DNA-binding GntR family transcriptional regulator
LRKRIADELRRLILSGELTPGMRLRQMGIAERFDVSPTPVREAFKTLAEEGLVDYDAQRGVFVFTPTVDDVMENYEIRIALEPLATELAARSITDEELAELDKIVKKMRATKVDKVYQALNRDFHALIYAAARRRRLEQMIKSQRDIFEAYVTLDRTVRHDPDYQTATRAQHESIAEALKARAPKRARKLMAEHLESNRRHIAGSVEVARAQPEAKPAPTKPATATRAATRERAVTKGSTAKGATTARRSRKAKA